ncbi:urate hydroxylase PuuD [Stutzerimonas kirkiae]|uniref:Urate oxidase N-terminal domain-containing protein n=1 Tax=Stutzerimonas kirkiae TaxID=2211392 RepID=A0A4Q9RD53_9GAMM|nr:urate hydroxylase PuuD [Stutzerimonas kirkiae]TBU98064.1 hypothetical protein DNJ96_06440 [Stutzerimonas kirkiae]TBV02915.1 hypothetical protein DNJ95_08100 [Stutzerimonas kirkiae]TBV11115.1 hypothetical protein DNK08_04060 [Stutzerimonas kirkiae]TBV13017.1 hypothetical protein DNK01_12765 [Stutzerimonas kirkiae]
MEAHLTEWLNLSIRWVHMIVGIAWIGASFYFVWLENNLERDNPGEGLSGDLWAIHGGGIYHLEKYKLAPAQMPEKLHWFKWEAYSTWLSGVALLTVVYYLNPAIYLIAPGSQLSPAAAVAIGLGSLLAGWLVYDRLCDSPLGRRPGLLGALLFALIVFAAWAYAQVFSGRAAYIHVGALIGTLMVGNVFRVIMPAQRELVTAIGEGRQPDPGLPGKGLLRSRHNNYFTLPVLFIMISNHFPSTYGSQYNWLILAAIALIAVLVRHYFNTRQQTRRFAWALPAAALALICLAFVSAPRQQVTQPPAEAAGGISASAFGKVSAVIHERCTVCHSSSPTSEFFSTAPAGVMFDSDEQIRQMAARIHAQAVATPIMPPGNITQMTQEERDLLGHWIAHGAHSD